MRMSKTILKSGAALLLVLAAGCSSMSSLPSLGGGPAVIHVDVPARAAAAPLLRDGRPVALAVAEFGDARPGSPGRKVGDIRATVLDIHGTEFALDQDVPAVLGGAARGQLGADGFRLVGAGEADFLLSGTIRRFSLDIGSRDELAIAVDASLREARSGNVVWAGTIEEKSDRYAGVNGNTRATIAEYLGAGTAAFTGKLGAVVRDSLARAYPRAIVAGSAQSPGISGVTTTQPAVTREAPAVAAPVPPAPAPAPPVPVASAAGGVGFVAVASVPARAKVYVDDVYYGVAPIRLELPAGVSLLRFKLDGYKPATEKVAVRRGATTELEVKLER